MRARILVVFVVACSSSPVPSFTRATCPDVDNPQLTWANFGSNFACHYCTNCHDSSLTIHERNGAQLFHDFDTLYGLMGPWDHVDQQAAWGPKAHNDFMPGAGTNGRCPSTLGGPLDEDCPEPTPQEREDLGTFIACEHQRPQDYSDSDAGVSDHCANYTGPH